MTYAHIPAKKICLGLASVHFFALAWLHTSGSWMELFNFPSSASNTTEEQYVVQAKHDKSQDLCAQDADADLGLQGHVENPQYGPAQTPSPPAQGQSSPPLDVDVPNGNAAAKRHQEVQNEEAWVQLRALTLLLSAGENTAQHHPGLVALKSSVTHDQVGMAFGIQG